MKIKIKFKAEDYSKHKTACLVIGVFEASTFDPMLKKIDRQLNSTIASIIKAKDFTGKAGQTRLIYTHKKIPCDRILLVGMGKKKDFTIEEVRKAAGASAVAVREIGTKSFSTLLSAQIQKHVHKMSGIESTAAVTEGTLLALYNFTPYKTENTEEIRHVNEVILLFDSVTPDIRKGISYGVKLSEAVWHARDMINHPGNMATPTFLAGEAKKVSRLAGVKCRTLDRVGMEKLGMRSLLAVAKGSVQPPKFITLEYAGGKNGEQPVVIVGKGLTFDSGGISLKPAAKMDEMKYDMSGGAAAIATLEAAANLKLKINLVALIPSTENMPGGRANKPGDVLKSMSGKTIEVINTDAEGRLILADALTYAERYKPRAVIDIATLTGACVIALGNQASAVLSNDADLIKALKKAGEETGERVWELPLWKEYEKQISSNIADMKNTGGRAAGTITAALFLKKFASKYKWAHLDIAGTAWSNISKPYIPKGATGVGVRLLIKYLRLAQK